MKIGIRKIKNTNQKIAFVRKAPVKKLGKKTLSIGKKLMK
jgi:hypothetical protein